MFYRLEEPAAVEYVRNSTLADRLFKGMNDLKASSLPEGNVNLIFRVFSESDPIHKSVILKQALPFAWRYPDFKMPQERARIEYEMLTLENKYCPGLAPVIYQFDEEMFTNAMEDLNQHIIMRYGLVKQIRYPKFAEHIGIFLARTLFYTSDFYLPSAEKKAMLKRFINPVMCRVTEDLVFTQPYKPHANNHWTKPLTPHVQQLYADDALYTEMLALKEKFMANAEALIHGDLHTGSIMVNENETKVIDPEFGYFGPMGFDIGAVLGNLLLSYASQGYHASDSSVRESFRQWLLETIVSVWEHFESEFRLLWETKRLKEEWASQGMLDKTIQSLLQDTAGFGAAKAMRRILGLAHVPDLEMIPDESARAVCESLALNAAQSWVMNRHEVKSIYDLVEMIQNAVPNPAVG
jgi:5-methylthioribose kinase